VATQDQPPTLICNLAVQPPAAPSKLLACDLCHADIWVGKVMWPKVLLDNMRLICITCLPGVLADDPDYEFKIAPEQVDELRNLGIHSYSKRLIKNLNDAHKRNRKKGRGLGRKIDHQSRPNPLFRNQ
jgi:hypothetical protein